MTLGPKFYTKLVSAITRRIMNEYQRFLADFVQNFMYIVNLLSKRILKHFSKIDILGFAAIIFEKLYTSDKRKQMFIIQKHVIFKKNGENQLWSVLQYVKQYAEFKSAIHFGWNLLKWHVFDDFHFLYFLWFCIFFYFGGRRHEALAFK